ncbi:insulinase family protein [bacterium]|nr:insulinase family protein [bacterium]
MKTRLLALLLLFPGLIPALAQPLTIPPDPATPLPTDTAVASGTLPNGLRYYVRANRKPANRAELRLAVRAGSVLERDDERGLSHFLEHMAFNGTRNFPHQALIDYTESIGMRFGANMNAGTGYDRTVYMLTVPTDSAPLFRKGLQILEDWAHQITLDPAEIDKERGVIVEEWRLGRDAQRRIWEQQSQVLLSGSRYIGRDPIGDTGVILHFPARRIVDYYRRWYRPDLMAVVAVGDFDRDAVAALIRKQFGAIKRAAGPKRPLHPVPAQSHPRYSVATDPEATATEVGVNFLRPPDTVTTVGGARREIALDLVSAMLNQRLDELSRQARPPFTRADAARYEVVEPAATFSLGASVTDDGVTAGLAALLTEARRVRLHGFTATELARAKAELLRQAERQYQERDKTESRRLSWRYVRSFTGGDTPTSAETDYQLARALVPAVALDEVNATARDLISGSPVIMASGPARQGLTIATEAGLQLAAERAESQDVAPYVDKVAGRDLMPRKPKPGRVVKQSFDKGLGLHDWRLSNGVRVLLKPTDFKNDEVLLRSFGLGGTSLADSANLPSAQLAAVVISEGGLAGYDRVQLDKYLAGKIVSVSPALGRFDQGVTASASPGDLAAMLQLVHLYHTAPRRDSAAFRSLVNRMAADLRNRDARPETALSDTFQLILGRHSYRSRPLTEAVLSRADLNKAFTFYQQRFGAGGQTFVIVGSFDPDSVRPLVEAYLGSLPAAVAKPRWRDDGVRYPAGVNQRSIAKGVEQKATVRLAFPAGSAWNQRERLLADVVSDYLDIRLREVVREDKGGTYSIWAYAQTSAEPAPQCLVTIGFGCAPQRAAELTAAVFAEIDSLRQRGIPASYLAKIKEIDLKEWETNSKQNGYWSGVLYQYARYGEDPAKIPGYPDLVRSLTAEDVHQAALRYLDPARYVKVSLLPEKAAGSDQAPPANK